MVTIEKITGVFLKYGYTVAQIAVLDHANRAPGQAINRVAGNLGMRQSSVTACLTRLHADKLVETGEVVTPPRGHALTVTTKGRKLLAAMKRELNDDDDL